MIKTVCVVILCVVTPVLQRAVGNSYITDRHSQDSFLSFQFGNRVKTCGYIRNEFRCRDGTCVSEERKCDGTYDCPDGTDETYHLCRNNRCSHNEFRCTYGGCVEEAAVCDGVADCADGSDELLRKCRNRTDIVGTQFRCNDGNLIEVYLMCDGKEHCRDGSDETLLSCAGKTCLPNTFQCAYGACVDEGSDCDNVKDCADGSDEMDDLCNGVAPRSTITQAPKPTPQYVQDKCILPPHPKNGRYLKNGHSPAYNPGEALDSVYLNVTCNPGFKVVGEHSIICLDGYWTSNTFPICVRACELKQSPRVKYHCVISEEGSQGFRSCEDLEVDGTIVYPECNAPNYYSPAGPLDYMFCVDGKWSYEPLCHAECGTLTPKAEPLVIGGQAALHGEVPWHAGVYRKVNGKYTQICGASLISENALSSAAHCFYRDDIRELLPADEFAITVGNLHREWNHPDDRQYIQKSKVKEIILAPHYYGSDFNYQNDLVIVIVETPFEFRPYVRPVCLDFSHVYADSEIIMNNATLGKVSGWGLTSDQLHSFSPKLKVVTMPYVPFDDCVQRTPREFVQFITGDKFCAGFANGTTVCHGDSGGGWTYALTVQGTIRYYLGGIVSVGPSTFNGCNENALTSFTDIFKHVWFIRAHWIP